ncbi:MAG: hypothetical protein ACLP6G_07305 [Terriglobales bacterium]
MIERGIPIPEEVPAWKEIEERLPELTALGVGDSFVVTPSQCRTLLDAKIQVHYWASAHNQSHQIRGIDNGYYRVWRTA